MRARTSGGGRRRQGARHPHNKGDGLRMAMEIGAMPWGQWTGVTPRHRRRLGRLRAARAHRPVQSAELPLRRDHQPRGRRFVDEGEDRTLHLRQVRPRHPGRAGRQGLPAVRQQGAAPAGAARLDRKPIVGRLAEGAARAARHRRQGAGAQDGGGVQAAQRSNKTFDPTKRTATPPGPRASTRPTGPSSSTRRLTPPTR